MTTRPDRCDRAGISTTVDGGSVAVRGDHLAAAPGAQGPPGRLPDGILDEPDRAVGHADVDAARVVAIGWHVGVPPAPGRVDVRVADARHGVGRAEVAVAVDRNMPG